MADQFIPSVWSRETLRGFERATLEDFIWKGQRPEYLPVPWYGDVRNWLSGQLLTLSEWLTRLTLRVAYLPKVKPGTEPPDPWAHHAGSIVEIPRLADLSVSTHKYLAYEAGDGSQAAT